MGEVNGELGGGEVEIKNGARLQEKAMYGILEARRVYVLSKIPEQSPGFERGDKADGRSNQGGSFNLRYR